MLIIKSRYNFINIRDIASKAGIDPEQISLRRAEDSPRLWRAWLSNEVSNTSKKEKDLLWALICDGNEAVISESNNKGWRRALK